MPPVLRNKHKQNTDIEIPHLSLRTAINDIRNGSRFHRFQTFIACSIRNEASDIRIGT